MKRKISLILIMAMIMNLVSVFGTIMPVSTTMIASATETNTATPTPMPKDRTLKVLAIGSSFAVCCTDYFYELAKAAGAQDVVVGTCWNTATTIDTHWGRASGNLPDYRYYKDSSAGSKKWEDGWTMLAALQDEDWDVITIQQGAEKTADAGSLTANLWNVVNYINTNKPNPNTKIVWNATWAFRSDSCSAYIDQQTMYYTIINAAKEKAVPISMIDYVLPPGTAIQNARSSYLGDIFNRDSMHTNALGGYVAGMAWLKKITGWSIDDITWMPGGVTADQLPILKEAVNNAVANQYEITYSSYTPTPDPSAGPTEVAVPTPTPGVDGKIVVPLLKDNFEKYAYISDVTNAGWNISGTGTASLKTTAPPINHQSLYAPAGTRVSRTFKPVPLNSMGGKSPGKNAKLVISFDGNMNTNSGASQSYFKVDDSTYNAVSIGRRGGSVLRYSDSISSSSTDFTVASSLPKFTKVKFVVKLTDENGKFLDVGYTKVDIYINDMNTPITDGTNRRMIDAYTKTASRFYMGGDISTEIDNLDINLIVDSDNMPSETLAPTPTPDSNKIDLYNKILQAQNLYELANAHIGMGPGQYPPELVAALYAKIQEALVIYNDPNAALDVINTIITQLQDITTSCVPFPTEPPTPTPVPTATPEPTATPTATPTPIATIIVDNLDSGCTFDSPWTISTSSAQRYGINYAHDGNTTTTTGDPTRWAKWTPNITIAGTYNIYMMSNGSGTSRPDEAPLEIKYKNGIDSTQTIDQNQNSGQWALIGTYDLSAGTDNYVKLSAADAGATIADAVKFECISVIVDKTDLEKVLFEAEQMYDYVKDHIGVNDGEYRQADVDNLYNAIQNGHIVYDNANATQAEVDAATAWLREAQRLCVPIPTTPVPIPTATPTPVPTVEPTATPTIVPTATPTATIEVSPTPTPTAMPYGSRIVWQEDFSDTTKYPNVYAAYPVDNSSLNELKAAGWTVAGSVTSSPKPYVCDATQRYLRVSEGGGALHTMNFNLPETFRISNGTISSGVDPGHPGNNAKLTFEYKTKVSYRNSQWASAQLSFNSLQGQKVVGLGISGASPYTKSYYPADASVTPYIATSWAKYKHVITITDENGNYVKTADLYIDKLDGNGYVLQSSNIPYSTSAVTVGQFTVGTKDSYSNNGWWVDDICVTFSGGDTSTTASPTPNVDKTVLAGKIADLGNSIDTATQVYNEANANAGTLPGQYDPSLVAALNAAIIHATGVKNDAQTLYDNTDATQAEVDAKVIEVQNEIGALQAAIGVMVTNTPSPTIEPTPVPPTEIPSPTPTIVPSDYITSNDAYVIVDQVNKKISYYHYKKNNINYFQLSVMKTKLVAAGGFTYDIYQSDETTLATGTNMEPMYKVVVSSNGTKVATYTFAATMLYGDIDGSGTIIGSDLIWLRKYIIKAAQYPLPKPYSVKTADINKSGGVNGSDLLLLRKFILSSTKYPITGATEFIYDPTV